MKLHIILILIFLFNGDYLKAQLQDFPALQKMVAQPDYKNAHIAFQINNALTGEVVYQMNAEKLMIPASVMKLVTSAAALEILGAGYQFKTRLGYSGSIVNGTLKGDLIVIGGGDPALGSEHFLSHYFSPHFLETFTKSLTEANIKKIEGGLIIDNSLYENERIPPTWIWEDMGNYYGAPVSALTLYDNLSRITFQSPSSAGMPTKVISVYPPLKNINWTNEVLSSDIPRDQAYVFGSPSDNNRVIRGTIPKNRKAFTIKASNPGPEALFADEFLKYMASAGIFVTGKVSIAKVDAEEFNPVAELQSPPLAEIVKVLNRKSINLFAEHLVKQIAAEKTGAGERETGLKIITEFWEDKGLDTGQLFMEDGSGLSHFNAVSSNFISSLLCYMKQPGSASAEFYESLPGGGDGTLHGFSHELLSKNTFRLKSGSMKRVRCYAGYFQSGSGKDYSIVVLVNHFSGTHSKLISEIEKILAEIKNL